MKSRGVFFLWPLVTYCVESLYQQLYLVLLIVVPFTVFDYARYDHGTLPAVFLSIVVAILIALPAVAVFIRLNDLKSSQQELSDELGKAQAYLRIMELNVSRVDDN